MDQSPSGSVGFCLLKKLSLWLEMVNDVRHLGQDDLKMGGAFLFGKDEHVRISLIKGIKYDLISVRACFLIACCLAEKCGVEMDVEEDIARAFPGGIHASIEVSVKKKTVGVMGSRT